MYVYKKINNDYLFETKIFPNDPEEYALFGSSLLFSNGKLFVGAQNKKNNNIKVGALYVFVRENNNWIQRQKNLPPATCSSQSLFSNILTISQDQLLVSAFRAKLDSILDVGKVFLFKLINDQYVLQKEFFPVDAKPLQFFGSSLALIENTLLIGSDNDSTKSGEGSGSVYFYKKEDSTWNFKEKIIPELNSQTLAFGSSIAVNDSFVFVGTSNNYYYRKPGCVYIYNFFNNTFKLKQIFSTGDSYFNDLFGINLFIKGDSLLVGASEDTVKNSAPGSVYLFTKKNAGWMKSKKIVPSDEQDALDFGGRLLINKDFILVSGKLSRANNIRSGKVYLFSSKPLIVQKNHDLKSEKFLLF